jgi:hypothetical protein
LRGVGKYRPRMAKHRKPKTAYLPKVAAGAAPLALLLAGPATAWASESVPLPLDHQHTGSFDKGFNSGNSLDGNDHSGFLDGFITTTNRDVVTGTLGDVEIFRNLSDTAHHLETSHGHKEFLAVDPTAGPLGAGSQQTHHLRGSGAQYDSVWLPHGIDVVGQVGDEPTLDVTRNTVLTGDGRGNTHALSELTAAAGWDRNSGQAVDIGQVAAIGTSAQQFGHGAFSGTLDVARRADDAVTARTGDKVGTAIGQSRDVGGHLGPIAGWGSVSQGAKLGHQGGFAGTLQPDGTPLGQVSQQVDAALSGTTSGELNVEHVLDVQGGTETRLGASGDLTKQDGSFTQKNDLKLALFDQAPLEGGLTISGPPLNIEHR